MAMTYTAGLLGAQHETHLHMLKIDLGGAREMRAKRTATDFFKKKIPEELFRNAGVGPCLETVQNPGIVFQPSKQTSLL